MGYGGQSGNTIIQTNNKELADQIGSLSGNVPRRIDFVEELQKRSNKKKSKKYKILGDRNFEVFVPLNHEKYARYEFRKDANDDYIKLWSIDMSRLISTEKNYDTLTGTWVTSVATNYYTTVVGSTFEFTFEGTGFDFRHNAANNGGLWRFVIDGDTANPIDYSTYSPTTISIKRGEIVRGLTQGTHSVVATFMGDDPLNPPATSPSRGWIRMDDGSNPTRKTIIVYGDTVSSKFVDFEFTAPSSNYEFAISMNPVGESGTVFVPEHSSVGTAFATKQRLIIDGKEISNYTVGNYIDFDELVLTQVVLGEYPSQPDDPMCEVVTQHMFRDSFLDLKGKIKYLRNCVVQTGYVNMCPARTTFTNQCITGMRNKYATTLTDGTSTNLTTESDTNTSFAFINLTDSYQADYMLAMTVDDAHQSLRKEKTGRRNPLAFIQHRDTYVQKLYPQVYDSASVATNDVHYFASRVMAGRFYNVGDVF